MIEPELAAADILIVDDDPGAIRVLQNILSGFPRLRFAISGDDALRLARESIPDLILLDSEMPGMSGLEVCRALKLAPSLAPVPVIFVTANSTQELEAEALEAGAADFLAKPAQPTQVRARVRAQLRLYKLTQSRQALLQRIELALLAGDLGAWEWDPRQDRMQWHDSMAQVRPASPATVRCLGDHVADLAPEERERVLAMVRGCAEGGAAATVDYRAERDGDLRHIRSRVMAVIDHRGLPARVVGADQDYTDWQRSGLQLMNANRQLEQFAYWASHDLRAPARQMTKLATLALQRSAEGRHDIDTLLHGIEEGGLRMQGIVTSLLDLARHRLTEPGEWREVSMNEIVDAVLHDCAQMIRDRGVAVAVEPLPVVYVPVNLVAHVWRNLLVNAIQHQNAEQPRVWISCSRRDGIPVYSVEDAGTEAARLHRLIGEPARPGTFPPGLPPAMGVEIASKVLRVLGGRMTCDIGPHGGTRVEFNIAVSRGPAHPRSPGRRTE